MVTGWLISRLRWQGEKFLRSSIDATEFDVVRGGRLIVLTPQLIPSAASQAETLEKQGFVRTKEARFQLFETREIDQVFVYEKQTTSGESYRFGKWVVVLGFEDARSARNRTRAAEGKPFFVYPADIPNTGVLFVDRQKEDHSGHGHNSIAECREWRHHRLLQRDGNGRRQLEWARLGGMVGIPAFRPMAA